RRIIEKTARFDAPNDRTVADRAKGRPEGDGRARGRAHRFRRRNARRYGMHAPATHAMRHLCAHVPQLLTSVWRLTSHPSAALPLQLAKPALHAAMFPANTEPTPPKDAVRTFSLRARDFACATPRPRSPVRCGARVERGAFVVASDAAGGKEEARDCAARFGGVGRGSRCVRR